MFIQILTPSFRYFSTSFIYITIKEEKGYTIYLEFIHIQKKQELYYIIHVRSMQVNMLKIRMRHFLML